jgi:hypothetical protein
MLHDLTPGPDTVWITCGVEFVAKGWPAARGNRAAFRVKG